MLDLSVDLDDDPAFAEIAFRIIDGAVAVHRPSDVRVFKIDNWFDHKWLCFSGKVIGLIGIWQKGLTIPPFVANRLVRQWHFQSHEGEGYRSLGDGPNIHHRGWSAENLNRRVSHIAPSSALFWFSGNTKATGRGSLMGYLPVEQEYWCWFLSFRRDGEWKIARRKNIHEYEVRMFDQAVAGVSGDIVKGGQ